MVRSLLRSLLATLRGDRSIAYDADGETVRDVDDDTARDADDDTARDADDATGPAADGPGPAADGPGPAADGPIPAADGPGDDSGGQVRDVIPFSQYYGRHGESGGVARGEQERAIRDVELQAEAIDLHEDPTGAEPPEE